MSGFELQASLKTTIQTDKYDSVILFRLQDGNHTCNGDGGCSEATHLLNVGSCIASGR